MNMDSGTAGNWGQRRTLNSLNEGETAPSFTPLKRGRYSSKFRKHTAIRLSYDPSQIQAETKEDIEDAIAEGDLLQVKVRSASTTTPQQIRDLREVLKRLFETPCKKWRVKRTFPYKLLLQLLKVLIVTWQLAIFFSERASFEKFSQANRIAFHHVFLKEWSSDREILPYPPGNGEYALYTQSEMSKHMNYVLYQFYRFNEVTLTPLVANPQEPAKLEVNYFEKTELYPLNQSYYVDATPKRFIKELPQDIVKKEGCNESSNEESCYEIMDHLNIDNTTIEPQRIINISLTLKLYGIDVKIPKYTPAEPLADVECVIFNVIITYDNSKHGGRFIVKLKTKLDMKVCELKKKSQQKQSIENRNLAAGIGLTIFDVLVIGVSFISILLAARSLVQRLKKMKRAKHLFKDHYGVSLTVPEILEFITLWYIQYIISDLLVIAATGIKIYLKYGAVAYQTTFNNEEFFNAASIMLAIANWSQWIGLIRFLGYFERYYVLILTLTNAIPAIVRFLVCGLTIFFGYLFAGWVVLGPYNEKFETVHKSAQSLFSLINGDEIYATMSIINYEDHPTEIWLISCLYLYSYIILFVFAIANLFIAVIMDSYETIKNGGGYQKTFLHHFVHETLQEEGTTDSDTQQVLEEQDEDAIDQQYGLLRPFVCCLDKCVHYSNTDYDLTEKAEDQTNTGLAMASVSQSRI